MVLPALLLAAAAAVFPMHSPLNLLVARGAGDYLNETPQERDLRMRWWREARFGMFVHWGLYAVPAGEYKGQRSKKIEIGRAHV